MIYELTLDWPPTVNHYYIRNSRSVNLSQKAENYREFVAYECAKLGPKRKLLGRIWMIVELHPPDAKLRDIDNVMKGLLDSLQYGGCFRNDSQIKLLVSKMHESPCRPHGKVIVRYGELKDGIFKSCVDWIFSWIC